MHWNKHYDLIGKHAILGASTYQWVNDKTIDDTFDRYCRAYSQAIGTALHEYARQRIENRLKINDSEINSVLNYVLESGIPKYVVPIDRYFENFATYVNDAICFGMTPEVPLQYSDIFFGTTDAIAFDEKKKFLRIHDLKTGVLTAHFEQLYVYAALFCLEYKFKPKDISMELRLYQNNETVVVTPSVAEIAPIIDKIVTFDKLLRSYKDE